MNTQQIDEKAVGSFFDKQSGTFFRGVDWIAFLTCFLVTMGAYYLTLAPTVTLEDAGELAVASDYLGVPHPPGYPIWSLLTWFFQWVLHFSTYNGSPNPAWPVALASAVFGAGACGLLALLVSRSGADMLSGLKDATQIIGTSTENAICWASGVSAGLLFAFSPVLWSQAVIVEVYSLNALFLMVIIVLLYMWMERQHDYKYLWAVCFLFGLGLTNHQTLMFLGLALVAAVAFKNIRLFRDFFIVGAMMMVMVVINAVAAKNGRADLCWNAGWDSTAFWFWNAYMVIVPIIAIFVLPNGRTVGIAFLLVLLGVSFYMYMPISSEQNPPINWGYPRTWEGFMHAITRGQYEKIDFAANLKGVFSDPYKFLRQINAIVTNPSPRDYSSVVAQYTWFVSLAALVPLFFLRRISIKTRKWLITTMVGFLSMTIIFIIFQDPKFDVQTLFIMRVQYIQAHAIFAIWIGYGLAFLLTFIDTRSRGSKPVIYVGLLIVLLMPLIPVLRNYYDEHFIKILGGCEQNGHDFGWQFGNWQLRGVNGIKNDLQYEYPDPEEFEKVWAEYPTPDYPPEMGTNAIFFGGTDPGRFVPTYMIYCAKVRPDVFLITQNALADNTYMNVMRDLMGNDIWIPSQTDSNLAFQQYVEDVRAGRIPAGAAVTMQDGRVSVQGVQGVMMINGILCKMIFEQNKHKHPFYVEESYVIPWMYDYMEPHGLILKINNDPLPGLSQEVVDNDHKFWDWYVDRLMGNPKFLTDVVARKTFSKLRSAIAGLYAYRRNFPEAEYAFGQAIELYPLSPEANFRLADIYMQQRKFKEAAELIKAFLEKDPGNDRVAEFLTQIEATEQIDARRQALEAEFASGQADINKAFELAQIYQQLNLMPQFEQITRSIIYQTNLPPQVVLQVAQLYANAQRLDLLQESLEVFLQRNPGNAQVMVDLAAVYAAQQKTKQSIAMVRQAIQAGGADVRDRIRQDQRFMSLQNNPEFQRLVPPLQQNLKLPFAL
jgi:tetratricopeptide (TPR) repeat protein